MTTSAFEFGVVCAHPGWCATRRSEKSVQMNYYLWKDVDWLVVLVSILALFTALPALLIFETIVSEVNARSTPEQRFIKHTMLRGWTILRAHSAIFPESHLRRRLGYFLAGSLVLAAALILRMLYLSDAASNRAMNL